MPAVVHDFRNASTAEPAKALGFQIAPGSTSALPFGRAVGRKRGASR